MRTLLVVPWLVAIGSIAQAYPIVTTFDTPTTPIVTGYNIAHNYHGGWWDGTGAPPHGSYMRFCAFDYAFGDVRGRDFTVDLKGNWSSAAAAAAGTGVYIFNGAKAIWNDHTLTVEDTAEFKTFTQSFSDKDWICDGGAASIDDVLSNVTRIELMDAPTTSFSFDNVGFTPEPAAASLLCVGVAAVLVRRRRRR